MEEYKGELFTKGDIIAGLKLIFELAGVSTFISGILTRRVILKLYGVDMSDSQFLFYACMATEKYAELSTEKRKIVRAAINYLKGFS